VDGVFRGLKTLSTAFRALVTGRHHNKTCGIAT